MCDQHHEAEHAENGSDLHRRRSQLLQVDWHEIKIHSFADPPGEQCCGNENKAGIQVIDSILRMKFAAASKTSFRAASRVTTCPASVTYSFVLSGVVRSA